MDLYYPQKRIKLRKTKFILWRDKSLFSDHKNISPPQRMQKRRPRKPMRLECCIIDHLPFTQHQTARPLISWHTQAPMNL